MLCTMPEWLRCAPPDLVPLLGCLMGQEEAREFDREGKPRPRRGAAPPCTALELGGQGPVVVGPKGGTAVAAMLRDVANAAAARREAADAGGEEGRGDASAFRLMGAVGSGATMLTLRTVDLTECGLGTAAAGEVMQAAGCCPTVEVLLLGGNGIEDGIVSDFTSMMRQLTSSGNRTAGGGGGVRTLGLERNSLTDRGAAGIVTVLDEHPGALMALDLNGNTGLGAATVEALNRVLRNRSGGRTGTVPRLARVGLAGTQLDDASLAAIIPALTAPTPAPSTSAFAAAYGGEIDGAAVTNGGGGGTGGGGVDELDLSGNAIDSQAIEALAEASQRPGYGGGPRLLDLSRATLSRASAPVKRPTAVGGDGASVGASGASRAGGSAAALAEALIRSPSVEELRMCWCGLGRAGMRVLVHRLMDAAANNKDGAASSAGKPRGSAGESPDHVYHSDDEEGGPLRRLEVPPKLVTTPLAKLVMLDLSGNKLGAEGVVLLGALLPVGLPALRHLLLEECGLGGAELGVLAGCMDLAPWVVQAVCGALSHLLTDDVTGGVRGVWCGVGKQPARGLSGGLVTEAEEPGGPAALAAVLKVWLEMEPAAAAAEVRQLTLPGGGAAALAAEPAAVVQPRSSTALSSGMLTSSLAGMPNPTASKAVYPGSLLGGMATANGAAAANTNGDGGIGSGATAPPRLGGLGCLLIHPVVQPVLEALRALWEALTMEAATTASAGGRDNLLQLPMYTREVRQSLYLTLLLPYRVAGGFSTCISHAVCGHPSDHTPHVVASL